MKEEINESTCEMRDGDDIIAEIDVILCRNPGNSELYRIQYPIRKVNPFGYGAVKARYKKNVKMLEMRLPVDKLSSSFDKGRAEHLALISGTSAGPSAADNFRIMDEEMYVGRSFGNDAPVHYAVGFFKNQCLYVCPLNGTFDMKRSISYLNGQGKDDISDSEEEGSSKNPSPIRVRFKRPETERQKKRREQSSAHRSRLIEQDPWTPLNINCDTESIKYSESLLSIPVTMPDSCTVPDPLQLVEEAIIGEKLNALDLNDCNQLISLRRIRHLPETQQVRALMIKARCISTNEAQQYVSKSIPRHLLISRARECSHLVCNIWVLKSELLYSDDESVFRHARDLILCLFNSNLPVRRLDLQMAFGLSTSDLDGVLKTLNRIIVNEHERSWKLKHDDVEEFGKTKDELKVFIEEKRYWHKRWEEIHRYLMARKENAGNIMRRKKRANSRQNGSNDRAMKKRGCMKTVVID
ncbi:Sin-like protein region [Onchocerca flexuosa]|uniref:Sin-like protein region n=2 Tax=Onchocerca flexuosa TaxID=387005 RepID=A0A238C2Q7_9BILA|nr:Sin-like protein region [Onchocerca flexuosa]